MAVFPAAASRDDDHARQILERYRRAKDERAAWEASWRDCYDYALPARSAQSKGDRLFDGTAPDAVDQLAASLLSELTPPWAQWFGLSSGPDLDPALRGDVATALEKIATILQGHFDRSNFAVEIHQCYLDAIIGGTASLLLEETAPGQDSAFRFTAIPLAQIVLEEGEEGRLDRTYRHSEISVAMLRRRFPRAVLPRALANLPAEEARDKRLGLIEAVTPAAKGRGYDYSAILELDGQAVLLEKGRFAQSPFINFRWMKAAGEHYGRSPVMKALPDIKTANKVVELILKNASIAVTGIWQADDDGVLNPANIKLVPGTIIPKAVGSAGLTPLEAPGRFDVSQLVLDDLRSRIRHALLVDRLAQIDGPRMTATEVLERASQMARILGATFGRLQSELLTPLIMRALTILKRRGEIPDIVIDGRIIDLHYRSPLAQHQAARDAQNTLSWLKGIEAIGGAAIQAVDQAAAARWLGRVFRVPEDLILDADEHIASREGATQDTTKGGHRYA